MTVQMMARGLGDSASQSGSARVGLAGCNTGAVF
jgi:hypothetical protein